MNGARRTGSEPVKSRTDSRRAAASRSLAAPFESARASLRRFAELAEGRVALSLAAVAAGALQWALAASLQRAPSLGEAGPARSADLLSLVVAILTEEPPRLAACLAFALAARKARYGALALFGAVASTVFALVENLAYLAASPDTSTLWRLSWSTPIHVGAALAFVVALAPLARGERFGGERSDEDEAAGDVAGGVRRDPRKSTPRAALALRVAAAFGVAALWHAALNLGALAGPGLALRLAVGAANLAALGALATGATAALDRPSLIDLEDPRPARMKRRGRVDERDPPRGAYDGFERA